MVKQCFLQFSEELIKHGMSPNEGYVLLCISLGKDIPEGLDTALVRRNLRVLNMIDEEGNITEKGELITEGNVSKIKAASPAGSLEVLAEELRSIYPKIRLYNMPARSSQTDIIRKLEEFFKQYKLENFKHTEVIDAVTRYVKKCEEDNYKYMKLLKYLILKDKSSILADIITSVREGNFDEEIEQFIGDRIQ